MDWRTWLSLSLALFLLVDDASAQIVFSSPNDDGQLNDAFQYIPPGEQRTIFLYYRSGSIPTSLGEACDSGNGSEICALAFDVIATGTLTLDAFVPDPGRDVSFDLASDQLRANLLDAQSPSVGTFRLGELQVSAAPLVCSGSCAVEGGEAEMVAANLVLRNIPFDHRHGPFVAVPEPAFGGSWLAGLSLLAGLAARRRRSTCDGLERRRRRRLRLVSLAIAMSLSMSIAGPFVRTASGQSQILDAPIIGNTLPSGTVSLTYDDGPGRNTLPIAEYLHAEGIRATFFVNGCRFHGRPDPDPLASISGFGKGCESWNPVDPRYFSNLLDRLVELGHRIGNHDQDHINLDDICPGPECLTKLTEQVAPLQSGLERHIQDGVLTFRAPFLGWSPSVAAAMRIATPHLIAHIGVDISAQDYSCLDDPLSIDGAPPNNPLTTPQDCAQRYLDVIGTSQPDHGIILLHDRESENEIAGLATGTMETLALTQHLVAGLKAAGMIMVPLDAVPGVLGPRRFAPQSLWTTEFSDAESWDGNVGYWGTVQLVDVSNDGLADFCGRGGLGLWCVISTGSSFAFAAPSGSELWSTSFSNAAGWLPEPYATTIRYGDIDGDGDQDVCGRFSDGIRCALGDPVAHAFGALTLWSTGFSDADGWDTEPGYYASIRLADVNGDGRADVCGRGAAGLWCAHSTGSTFAPMTLRITSDFSNASGWLPDRYGSTMQFGDLDGDGRDDVCGRGVLGIRCALAQTGGSFGAPSLWIRAFSDLDGFDSARSWYRTIDLVDVNGDGRADVCGRAATGIACATSNGSEFVEYQYRVNDHWTDATSWGPDLYGSTVRFGDLDGDGLGDVCGRAIAGVRCALALSTMRADADADLIADVDDNCKYTPNPGQVDTGGLGVASPADGTGDDCQCGDVDADGYVTPSDLALLRDPATDPTTIAGLCSVFTSTLDGDECDLADMVVLARALASAGPGIDPVCTASVPSPL